MSDNESGWKVSGSGVAFSLLMFLIAAAIVFAMLDSFRLFAAGEATKGTLLAKEKSPGPKNTTNYRFVYAFKVDEKDYSGSTSVNESDFNGAVENGPLPVVYLPGKPEVNEFEGAINDECFGTCLACGGLGFVGVLGLFFSVRRRRPDAPAYTRW